MVLDCRSKQNGDQPHRQVICDQRCCDNPEGTRGKKVQTVIWHQMATVFNNNAFAAWTVNLFFSSIMSYLPTILDSPELLRKSASNYGITARGKIITEIVDYGNLVTSGNNW